MMSSSILHLYVHGLFTPLVPTSPPDDINIEAIHATALMIFWRPPSYHPNGIIRRYVLRLSEIETGRQEQFFTNNTTITISNRHPFYYYSCIISAETIGQGPFSKAVIILMPEAGTLRSSSHCFLMCILRTSRISFVLEQCLDNCLHYFPLHILQVQHFLQLMLDLFLSLQHPSCSFGKIQVEKHSMESFVATLFN